jgi:cytochrome c556
MLKIIPVIFLTLFTVQATAEIPEEHTKVLEQLSPDAHRFFPIKRELTEAVSRWISEATGIDLKPGSKISGYACLTSFPHQMAVHITWPVGKYKPSIWLGIDRRYWSITAITVLGPEEFWEASSEFLVQFEGLRHTEETKLSLQVLSKKEARHYSPDSLEAFLEKQSELMKAMAKSESVILDAIDAQEGDIKQPLANLLKLCEDYNAFIKASNESKIEKEDLDFLLSTAPKPVEAVKKFQNTADFTNWDKVADAYQGVGRSCDACHASYQSRMSTMRKLRGGSFPGHFVVGHDLRRDEGIGQDAQPLANTIRAGLLLAKWLWPNPKEKN